MTLDELKKLWDAHPQYTSEEIRMYCGDVLRRKGDCLQGAGFKKIIGFYCEDQKDNRHIVAQVMHEVLSGVLPGSTHAGHYGAGFFLPENDSIRLVYNLLMPINDDSDLFPLIFGDRYPEIINRFRERLEDQGIKSILEIITEDRILIRNSNHKTIIPKEIDSIYFRIATDKDVKKDPRKEEIKIIREND